MTVTVHTAEEIDRALAQIRRRLDRLEGGPLPTRPGAYAHRRYLLIDHTKIVL